MSDTNATPERAATFINRIGINVHMEYTDGAYASEANVAADLAYLGIHNIRDVVPSTSGGIPAQNETTALEQLSAGGIKLDLFTASWETGLAADLAQINILAAAHAGSIAAIEGPNEINNFPVTYDGLTGQAAATAMQTALFSLVRADSALKDAAVYGFTGGTSSFPATPYGTLTRNANGSYTLVNGITGWPVTLPPGETTLNIVYTGASPAAGLFGYPGRAQETGLYDGVNGKISFTYDNTNGAPMQTYVTVSAWGETSTITAVSAVSGKSGNLVKMDPKFSLAGQANDANAHPYPSGGAFPGWYIANAYVGPYGIADPPNHVITEDGYNTDPNDPNGVSDTMQAIGDVDILLDGAASGAQATDLYELLDEEADPGNTNGQMHFGVFNNNNTPKPAAVAIHDLTTILSDKGAGASTFTTGRLDWSASGLPDTANSLLLEKSNGDFELALWNESAAPASSITIFLGGTYQNVEVFNPIVSATPVETFSNVASISLALGEDPLIIQVAPNTSEALASIAEADLATAAAPQFLRPTVSALTLPDAFGSPFEAQDFATPQAAVGRTSEAASRLSEPQTAAIISIAMVDTHPWLEAVRRND